jgi:hypothetical protein
MALESLTNLDLGFLIFLIILSFILLIFVILTLVHQYKKRKFGWFWTTLLLAIFTGTGLIIAIIYWINYLIKKRS